MDLSPGLPHGQACDRLRSADHPGGVDWFRQKHGEQAKIGACGYAEGGLIAFYAAAMFAWGALVLPKDLYAQLGLADRTEIEFFQGGHSINGEGAFDFCTNT